MVRRAAPTGVDKLAGIKSNIRVQFDGDAVLTSKNEADNPRMDRFNVFGDLEEWLLDSPPEEYGFRPYVKGPGFKRETAQADGVDFEEPYFEQRGPLINGDDPPDPTTYSPVAPFAEPAEIELVPTGSKGFAAGWYGFTFAYGLGNKRGKKRVTNTGSLFVVYLEQGQNARVYLPDTVTDGVKFIAVGATRRYETENQALNADRVFYQRSVSVKPRVPDSVVLKKHVTRDIMRFDKNETLGGGKNRKTKHRHRKRPGKRKNKKGPINTEISYQLRDEYGWTDMMGTTAITIEEGEAVEFEPEIIEDEFKAWRPMYARSDGAIMAMSEKTPGQSATLSSDDDEDVEEDDGETPTVVSPSTGAATGTSTSLTDKTGIEGPSSGLDEVVPEGEADPTPGRYTVRLTKLTVDPDDETEGETAPNAAFSFNLPAGFFFRIKPPPQYRNRIPNPEVVERQPVADAPPVGWTRWDEIDGIHFPESDPGTQIVVDQSLSETWNDVLWTDRINVADRPPSTIRCHIKVDDLVGGRVKLMAWTTTDNEIVTAHELATIGDEANKKPKRRFGRTAGQNIDFVWANNVKWLEIGLRTEGAPAGAGSIGPTNLVAQLWNPIFIRGKKHPRKRGRNTHKGDGNGSRKRRTSLSFEEPLMPYPIFGYTTVVLDPEDDERPIWTGGASTYLPGNFIEYYGPDLTPITATFFADKFRMPVKPGELRTLSMHFYWEGVDQPGTPLKCVLKDRDDKIIQDYGAFEGTTGVVEDSRNQVDSDVNGWVRRKLTVVIPDNSEAAYLELIPGGVGDGIYRIMGPQNELGGSMTTWSATHASSGYLVSTFDLGPPGVPQGSMKGHAYAARLIDFDAEITHDIGTSHTIEARSRYYNESFPVDGSGWVDSVEDLELKDILQIRTNLFTSDLDYTPQLHNHYVTFERQTRLHPHSYGTLLRHDGTEFPGTTLVFDFPPIKATKGLVEEEMQDHSRAYGVIGNPLNMAEGFALEVYLRSTAEEIMRLAGEQLEHQSDEEASTFIIEIRGQRHRARIIDLSIIDTEAEAHMPIPGLENDGKWNLQATGINAEITGSEDI